MDKLAKTLRHELGHWVAAKQFGFGVGNISIRFIPLTRFECEGSALIFPDKAITTISEMVEYSRARVTILYAGVIAGSIELDANTQKFIINDNALQADYDHLGRSDNQKAIEHCYILKNILHPDETPFEGELKVVKECAEEAEKFVNSKIDLIHNVAHRLIGYNNNKMEDFVIPPEDIQKALDDYLEQQERTLKLKSRVCD